MHFPLVFLLSALLLGTAVFATVQTVRLHRLTKQYRELTRVSRMKDKLLALGSLPAESRADETDSGQGTVNLNDLQPLTLREMEIVRLCCEGLQSKEIASRLNISKRTVETHKNNIFRKLGISSTADLVRLVDKRNNPQRAERP